MLAFETAIRLIIIGQQLLIAAIFLHGGGSRIARISGALLMLSVAGYLFNTSIELRESLPVIIPLVSLLGIMVPYALWSFARAIFEAPWPRTYVTVIFGTTLVLSWLVFVAEDFVGQFWFNTAFFIEHVAAIIVVLHAIWLAASGRPDDLVERRRRFRVFFIVIVAIDVFAVLTVQLVLVTRLPPGWLSLTNVLVIAALTIGLAISVLRLRRVFFVPGPTDAVAAQSEAVPLSPADTVLQQKLLAAMAEGAYRETGLTISSLASGLNHPEHHLRRLINGHLGFRNFTAFLNSYRIKEAQERLSDLDRVRVPVLTTALDLGYGSLGPFNRAFKESTGMTPTEFRQQSLSNANSE
jgi:AraC-like DNA-binding protein